MQTVIAPAPTGFDAGATTHPGRVRSENEDCFMANTAAGLWAVADGMGGHEAGQLASATVIQALGDIAGAGSAAELLSECESRIVAANAAVVRLGAERGALVGSTLAVLLAHRSDYACIWSGDSRIYRIRAGATALITRDHTEVQDLIDRGVLTVAEARNWPRRNVITRAIGAASAPELEIEHGLLASGDVFVLCSDGLTTHVTDSEIGAAALAGPPQQASEALVNLALDRGGTDNVTVIVVRYRAALW